MPEDDKQKIKKYMEEYMNKYKKNQYQNISEENKQTRKK